MKSIITEFKAPKNMLNSQLVLAAPRARKWAGQIACCTFLFHCYTNPNSIVTPIFAYKKSRTPQRRGNPGFLSLRNGGLSDVGIVANFKIHALLKFPPPPPAATPTPNVAPNALPRY